MARITLTLDGKDVDYLGDVEVFNWHRGGSIGPHSASAALMTLEQWLYDLLPDQEALAKVLQQVLSWPSAAVLGVLSDLALREPSLLLGALEPLVTGLELYRFGFQRALLQHVSAAMIPWNLRYAEDQRRRVYEWHVLEHRKRSFAALVSLIWVRRGFDWPALSAARERWTRQHPSASGPLDVAEIIATFDRTNWREVVTEEGPAWQLVMPSAIAEVREHISSHAWKSLLQLNLPDVCWRLLRAEVEAPELKLQVMFEAAREAPSGKEAAATARCAVAAVAVVLGQPWLDSHPEEQALARAWLTDTSEIDPADHWDSGMDPFMASVFPMRFPKSAWFQAVGVVELWSRERADPALRRALAVIAMAASTEVLAEVFKAMSMRVGHRDADLRKLCRLVVEHAAARVQLFVHGERESAVAHVREQALEGAKVFADGLGEELDGTWPGPSASSRGERIPYDPECLTAMFEGLLAHGRSLDDAEWLHAQLLRLQQHAVLGRLVTTSARAKNRPRDVGTPYDSDRKVAKLIATGVVLQKNSARRAELWRPWLALGGEHHLWCEDFLDEVYEAALVGDAGHVVREIVMETLDRIEHGEPVDQLPIEHGGALVGVHRYSSPDHLFTGERAGIVSTLIDVWERACEVCIGRSWGVGAFIRLMRMDAFSEVRVRLLAALGTHLQSHVRLDDSEEDQLARLLAQCWSESPLALRSRAARNSFDRLLNLLVGRQNRLAITLAEGVSRGLS